MSKLIILITLRLTAGFLLLSIASASYAICKKPTLPNIPDAELASAEEVTTSKKEVALFMEQTRDYLSCEPSNSRKTIAKRKMKQLVKNFNTMVTEYKSILVEYQHNQAQQLSSQ